MDRLKSKRTSRRAQNTRIINEASALLANDSASYDQLNSIYERLKANNDELQNLNNQIEQHIPDEEFEAEYNAVLEYEDNATRTLAEILSKKDRMLQSSTLTEGTVAQTVAASLDGTGVRLPKLTIAPFSGDLCKWTEFWEQFDHIVHSNVRITATEKFHYLRLYLTGDAASVIAGLPTTASCYNDAITMLQKRFGDKTRLEQEYFAKLRMLTPVRSTNDTKALRNLYDYVLVNIRGLETLGVHKSSFSSMLCDILLRALPRDIVVQYHRSCAVQVACDSRSDATPVGLDGLLNFLGIELESLEKSDFNDAGRREFGTTPAASQLTYSRRGKPTSSVLHSNASREPKKDNCVFCSSSQHKSELCTAELPLTQKKELLSNDKRCFRCTTKGHRARDCKRKISCSRCQARHATSMCDPDGCSRKTDYVNKNDGKTTTVCASLGKRPPNEGSIACVFLQTFRAWAINDDTCRYIRGVFDGGSQRTFITEALSKHLRLKSVGTTRIALNTFASASDQEAKRRRIVELRLRSQFSDQEIVIAAIEIPHICQDIEETTMDAAFVASFKKLGKDVADELIHPSVITNNGISVLIGSDQMWKILTGEVSRCEGNESLIALNSKFGWTFQGSTSHLMSQTTATRMMVCVLKVQATDSDEFLRSFWELENIGITDTIGKLPETSKTMIQFEKTISFRNGRYEVALPWKDGFELASNRSTKAVKQGDVVLVHADNASRQLWKLARVMEVYHSADGLIRSCKIKLQGGLLVIRPVQRLYPLELPT
ncbi:uncharacterized protein LOC119382671 [Rhipicephalus sanguineus]|uniref:uncharacterized protein LOC119382671 n=1 Tax=Rhipicephalus sanguineus TaxID=34632 RepID=UPI001893E3A9|nr:uncharacterized protein LOC119382671 [Rhipicephalus sanguineus]